MTRQSWNVLNPRAAVGWMIAALLGTVIGFSLTAVFGGLPGSEALSVEDAVDAAAGLAFGLLGVAFLRRGVASGLGWALVAYAALGGLTWLMGGLADAIANGHDPSVGSQMLSVGSQALFIATFGLFVLAPLLLFPTGRLPSPRWRRVAWAAFSGVGMSMLAVLLTPGPVDEDVPAWGDNPMGISALDGVLEAMTVAGLVLLLGAFLGGVAAFVFRCMRYRGRQRKQMAWFALGAIPLIIGFVTDVGQSGVVQIVSAIVIFGGLIAGMAWPLLGAPARNFDDNEQLHAATVDSEEAAAATEAG